MFYSQCKEDEFLNLKFFKNKQNGKYIELGALDGKLYSNTKFFEDSLNWNGNLIEPHPNKFELLKTNRPNNFCFNNLISNSSEELKFRYFVDNIAAVSGVENTLSEHHFNTYFNSTSEWISKQPQNEIFIKPKTLTDVVRETNITHIDFMSLDVEDMSTKY